MDYYSEKMLITKEQKQKYNATCLLILKELHKEIEKENNYPKM